MKEKEICLLRQVRREIIAICRAICIQEWKRVDKCWETLELELTKPVFLAVIRDNLLEECRICMVRRNYLRLYDLLRYEIDSDIADCLLHISEEDRLRLSEAAKKKNEEALGVYHRRLLDSIQNMGNSPRIISSYMGTENISIFVREEECQYQLFSSENPWLESVNFVDRIEKDKLDEICVLGFGGGYLVQELERSFKQTKIKVYIPNIDIFKTVIDNISVYEILQDKNLELYLDFAGLMFFMKIQENLEQNKNFTFYIDRQELRALAGSVVGAEKLLQDSRSIGQRSGIEVSRDKETVGTKIEKYIKSLL